MAILTKTGKRKVIFNGKLIMSYGLNRALSPDHMVSLQAVIPENEKGKTESYTLRMTIEEMEKALAFAKMVASEI